MSWKKYICDGSFLWLGLVLLISLCIAFLLPMAPEDYWWYVRIGRETLASSAVPGVDTLTYSVAGQALYYHSWGSAVLFWLLYRAGGLTLTVLLRGVIVFITYTLVWFTARRAGAGRIGSSLVLLAAVLASSNNWGMRPQLLVYPLFAAALWILYRWQDGDKRSIWWLPLLALLWGNLHASYVLLIVLVLAALLFGKGDRRVLLLAFLAVLAAFLLNPRGWHSYEYVFNVFHWVVTPTSQQYSAEWSPPVNSGWQMNIFFLWLLVFPLLAALSPRKLSRLEWVWFLGFGLLALWGMRYVIWFILILAMLTGALIADWEKKWLHEPSVGNLVLNRVIPLFLIISSLAFLPGLREHWWKQAPAVTANTPVAAAEWLHDHPDLEGPLFSQMEFAGYLEYALPERPVWIDSRIFPFPVAMWEDYRHISEAAWDWEACLDRTGANLLMISQTGQPELSAALKQSPEWCSVYSDSIAAIYTRGGCDR